MILDEIQPVSENGKTFDSRIMMLSLILLLWEKEWVEECLWALYRINRNDGFIE
jgi:hypothetical protein